MKLFVIIPAYNEEKTIAQVIKSVPRRFKGVSVVKILVYDDGSVDKTARVAKQASADYVFMHKTNLGLARTFAHAAKKAVSLGADLVVNTDADNQYCQEEIGMLIEPIIANKADFVTGNRQVSKLEHMPTLKKYGNMLGSYIIRLLTGLKVTDASSGFRAMTSELINKVPVFSKHTYTHEMLIAVCFADFAIAEVPITFKRRVTGGSRLISKGVFNHMAKSAATILRAVLLYRALAVFTFIGSFLSLVGAFGLVRFLYIALFMNDPSGHIQSLVISSILLGIGFNIIILGFVADLISYNRKLIANKN